MRETNSRSAYLVAFVALAALLPASATEIDCAAPPQVVILATGGTIAGTAASSTEARYDPSKLSVDYLIEAVPQLAELADVRGEQVAQVSSQDMTDAIWLKLARRVNQLLASDDTDGIVITHGTDTMEETAFFMNLVVRSDKPVVLTGAMRPSTALSADGAMNLYNSVAVAASRESIGRGVLLVFNDQVHGARDVTKTNTGTLEAFRSPNSGPMGLVQYGSVRYLRGPVRKHTVTSGFAVEGLKKLPRVEIVYAHQNLQGDLIRAAVRAGAKGIVVAGVGNGNVSAGAIEEMAHAAKKGVVVVRSSRTGSGIVARNLEIDDNALGFVAADDLNPQDARILLKLALTRSSDPERIQGLFYEY